MQSEGDAQPGIQEGRRRSASPLNFTLGAKKMGSRFIAVLLVIGTLGWAPISMAKSFETGWLRDEKGSTDLKTNAVVVVFGNMFGTNENGGPTVWRVRYVGIEIPITDIDPKKVVVLGEDGKSIRHTDAEALEIKIYQKGAKDHEGKKGTLLKLFLERPAGFSFRIRYID